LVSFLQKQAFFLKVVGFYIFAVRSKTKKPIQQTEWALLDENKI